jgi:thioredoxin reductase (NADPH)
MVPIGSSVYVPAAALIETEALVIGAGPVGLFQAFQLGLLEIGSHIVDSLPYAGGQCIELYADKPIYDIPGTPRCTGRELIASLLRQLQPFNTPLHLDQEVSLIDRRADGRFKVSTSRGTDFLARTIFIAAGVGAFQPKRLKVEGLEKFENRQLFYRVPEPETFPGKRLLIVGGDDAALRWAMHFATLVTAQPQSVILLHRRDVFQAEPERVAQVTALLGTGALQFQVGQVAAYEEQDGRLAAVSVTGVDGQSRTLPVDAMLVFLGLSPKLGPLAHWGLELERKQVPVDTEKFSTRIPGIFAIGDINTYPGKKKLILSGFHESALAAFGAAAIVYPDRPTLLQYTTTSPRLHKLLGVQADASGGG